MTGKPTATAAGPGPFQEAVFSLGWMLIGVVMGNLFGWWAVLVVLAMSTTIAFGWRRYGK